MTAAARRSRGDLRSEVGTGSSPTSTARPWSGSGATWPPPGARTHHRRDLPRGWTPRAGPCRAVGSLTRCSAATWSTPCRSWGPTTPGSTTCAPSTTPWPPGGRPCAPWPARSRSRRTLARGPPDARLRRRPASTTATWKPGLRAAPSSGARDLWRRAVPVSRPARPGPRLRGAQRPASAVVLAGPPAGGGVLSDMICHSVEVARYPAHRARRPPRATCARSSPPAPRPP